LSVGSNSNGSSFTDNRHPDDLSVSKHHAIAESYVSEYMVSNTLKRKCRQFLLWSMSQSGINQIILSFRCCYSSSHHIYSTVTQWLRSRKYLAKSRSKSGSSRPCSNLSAK